MFIKEVSMRFSNAFIAIRSSKKTIVHIGSQCFCCSDRLRLSISDPGQQSNVMMIQSDEENDDDKGGKENESPEHFMEFYSPPRVAVLLRRMGFRAQYSLDELSGYNFLKFEDRARALRLYETHAPFFVMLSPPCTMYSRMQNLNFKKMGPLVCEQRFADADCMLDFSMMVANRQVKAGRLFCHEHPQGASSWRRPSVIELSSQQQVHLVTFDQCRTGLRTPSGDKPLKKPTTLMTNSNAIRDLFAPLRCICTEEHGVIQGTDMGYQVSTWCQVYTPELCRLLADGVQQECELRQLS